MPNNIFSSLLSRLNSVFNKAPNALPAFRIKSPIDGVLIIDSLNLSVYGQSSSIPFMSISLSDNTNDAKTISVQELLYLIHNQYPDFICDSLNRAASGLGSIALVDGRYALYSGQYTVVTFSTSTLWSIFKPVSLVLQNTKTDVRDALQQLAFSTASGPFLDYWGSIFGITRYTNEPDLEYSTRLLWQTIKPRLNNKAIESIIANATGIQSNVVDLFSKTLISDGFPDAVENDKYLEYTDPLMVADGYVNNTTYDEADDTTRYSLGLSYILGSFGVYLNVPLGYSYYQYTQAQIEEIVNSSKAAGTVPIYTIVQTANELFGIVSKLVESIETSIEQYYREDRVMFFGHDDFTFYSDHWAATNIPKYPWYQANLNIPSLSDGVLLVSKEVTTPSTATKTTSSYFVNGYLADGFNGNFSSELFIVDSSATSDYSGNLLNITNDFVTAQGAKSYVFSPVLFAYQRYVDEPFGPRIVDSAGDDIITVNLSTALTPIKSFSGISTKSSVSLSNYITYTTPLKLVAPTSISGIRFDAIQLQQSNIHKQPIYIPNVSIDNFGQGWNTNYSVTRAWLIPYQDVYGNLFYEQIVLPAIYPPPATSLRISNPTTNISADNVLVISGGQVTISWNVTNAFAATITQQDIVTGVSISTPIIFIGSITFFNITDTQKYTISVTGNNGQIASSSILVNVGAGYLSSAPTLTISANPDVCVLCSTNTSIVTYKVEFNSRSTESQVVTYPQNTTYVTIQPMANSPALFVNFTDVIAANYTTGQLIQGGVTGFGTNKLIFTPLNAGAIFGQAIELIYSINLLGNQVNFNGANITVSPDTFEISQQVIVVLPDPPAVNGIAVASYFADYMISATNFLTATTRTIPIYVQAIQQSVGKLSVNSVTPPYIVEAIGSTINEMVPIALSGTGFSSNMQVYVIQPISATNGASAPIGQYLECYLTSLDWVNNTLTFIAPRLQKGTYLLIVQKSDCEGNVIDIDQGQSLTYAPSTYTDPPVISSISPNVICVNSSYSGSYVVVYGHNFRIGGSVYIVDTVGIHVMPTKVINDTAAQVLVSYSTIGEYDILFVNQDGSSFATTNKPLDLITPTTSPLFNQFGYVNPIDSAGEAYYGSNFNVFWDIDHCENVSFTSSDSRVTASMAGNYIKTGSLSFPIYSRYTTITATAVNTCGNSTSTTITVTTPPAYIYSGIVPAVSTLMMNELFPYSLHLFAVLKPTDNSNAGYEVEITGDSAIYYATLSSDISITNQVINPIRNSTNVVDVTWKGFHNSFVAIVNLPYVVGIIAQPSPINPYNPSGQLTTVQLSVTAIYSDSSEVDVTNSARYSGYNPSIISVNQSGLVNILSPNGVTKITCTFGLFSYAVNFGIPDATLSVSDFSAIPAYSLPLLPNFNVRWQVTGVNPQTSVVKTTNNMSSFTYYGSNSGIDLVTAYIDEEQIISNTASIDWINFSDPIGLVSVYGSFYPGNNNGQFVATSTMTPAFTQQLYSWVFNLPNQSSIPNYPSNAGDETRPMVNVLLDANGYCTSVVTLQGNGYQAGNGPLSSFDAAYTGQILVKNAGNYTFTFYNNDGYILSIDSGATSQGGDYIGINNNGYSAMKNYPVMGGMNTRQINGDNVPSSVVVNFPIAGIYNYELDYSTANDQHLCLYGVVDALGNNPMKHVSYSNSNPPLTATTKAGIALTMTPASMLFGIVGNGKTFTASLQGNLSAINSSTVALSIVSKNVRNASINGTAVYSGNLIDYTYSNSEVLTATKQYHVTLSNNTDTLAITAIANVITFLAASLNFFNAYDALNKSNISSSTITVSSGNVIGISWDVKNPVSVTLFDSMNEISYELPNAGTRYITVPNTGYLTLIAYGNDGNYVEREITVVVNFPIYTNIVNSNALLVLNQTVNIYSNFYQSGDSIQVLKYSDTSVSIDGTIPPTNQYGSYRTLSVVASVSSNSYLTYNVSGPSPYVAYAALNYDPGPNFAFVNISQTTTNIGYPVVVSYYVTNATSLIGDFVNGGLLCLGYNSFTIYPDRTTTYTLTATSPRGITQTSVFTINVNPQPLSITSGVVPHPSVDYIGVNGVYPNGSFLSVNQVEETITLEVFGSGFLSGRTSTASIISRVQILIANNQNKMNSLGMTIVSMNSISDTYINASISVHDYTSPSIYNIYVMNDIAISTQNSYLQQIIVNKFVPSFVFLNPISAYMGESVDVYLDYVDSTRDLSLTLYLNGNAYSPYFIGANLDNTTFVSNMYQALLSQTISAATLNNYVGQLNNGKLSRRDVFVAINNTSGANKNINPSVGTKVSFIYKETTTASLSVHTVNGYGTSTALIVSEPIPSLVQPVNIMSIQGVLPTYVETGATVTIYGQGFTPSTIIFAGSKMIPVTYISANQISVIAPYVQNSTSLTILAIDRTTFGTAMYHYMNVSLLDPYTSSLLVTSTLYEGASLNNSLTTISNPTTGQIGNQGYRGSYLNQPTYIVKVDGLGDLTASSKSPSIGGYSPTDDNSIVSAQFTTLSLNEVTISNPNVISLGILNHVDLAPVK